MTSSVKPEVRNVYRKFATPPKENEPRQQATCTNNYTQVQCLVEFVRMRHRGRNLLSMIALFYAAQSL